MGASAYEAGGRAVPCDAEGFLLSSADWTEDLARQLAAGMGMELTERHLAVLHEARRYYEDYAVPPPQRGLILSLRQHGHGDLASSAVLATLFGGSAVRAIARLAGLPKPASCL
ncbi:MAG: TusE/DsrC/DsvC family sulfur relay protein [Succinivibrionaceae bacterium]|nr:TusE/DsrC/DsvC family sulfur relay protein [Succinivibrionaceae bacterium]